MNYLQSHNLNCVNMERKGTVGLGAVWYCKVWLGVVR